LKINASKNPFFAIANDYSKIQKQGVKTRLAVDLYINTENCQNN